MLVDRLVVGDELGFKRRVSSAKRGHELWLIILVDQLVEVVSLFGLARKPFDSRDFRKIFGGVCKS